MGKILLISFDEDEKEIIKSVLSVLNTISHNFKKLMGHAKEIITLDVYADNAQMIADGVAELQPFIDEVLPEEEQMYKEVTDVMVNLDFLDENLEIAG